MSKKKTRKNPKNCFTTKNGGKKEKKAKEDIGLS